MTNDRLDDLTGARFFAALGVVIYHFAPLSPLLFNPAAYAWVPYGKTCVSFFFTLSGFVLTHAYLGWFAGGVQGGAYRRFFRNRFARIFPAHAAVLILMIPLAMVRCLSDPWLADHPWLLVWTWLVNLALVQIYVPSFDAASQWNVPAWSIDCEVAFYAVFPFIAWGIGRWLKTPGRLLAAGVCAYALEIGALALTARVIAGADLPPGWDLAFTLDFRSHMPDLRLWEFAIGALAGAYWRQARAQGGPSGLSRPWARNLALAVGLAASLAIMAAPGDPSREQLSKVTLGWYALFTPAFALIILALASGRTWLSGLLRHPWTVRLGEASYALYLVHWSVLVIDNWLHDRHLDAWRLGFSGSLALSLALALALHRWVETPARRRLRAPDSVPASPTLDQPAPPVQA
jgi:peptidoglycan/LPS O-acetylase OafA/YrhL